MVSALCFPPGKQQYTRFIRASVKRELGGKTAVFVVVWQCVIAWVAALLVRLIGLALGLG